MTTVKVLVIRPGKYLGEGMKALPHAEAGAVIDVLAGPYAGNLIKQGYVSGNYAPPPRDEVEEITFLGKDGPPNPSDRDGKEDNEGEGTAVPPTLPPAPVFPPTPTLPVAPVSDEEAIAALVDVYGIGEATARKLLEVGIRSLQQLVLLDAVELSEDLNLPVAKIQAWQVDAQSKLSVSSNQ